VLSGHYPEIPHAQGLATLLVPYTTYFVERSPDVFRKIAHKLLELNDPSLLPGFFAEWLEKIGVYRKLRELGVARSSLPRMAQDAIKYYGWEPGKLVAAPVPMNADDVLKIYEMAF